MRRHRQQMHSFAGHSLYEKHPAHHMSYSVYQRAAITATLIILVAVCVFCAGCTRDFSFPELSNTTHTQSGENDGKLSVYFFDIGQGDSSLVMFGNTTILVDAAEVDMGDRVVTDLHRLNVTKIDLLVASHPHSDHTGGIVKVLDNFPVGQVLDSGLPHASPIYEHFLQTIDQKHIPYRIAVQGQTIELNPALRVLVLSPPEKRFGDDLNTNSIVLRISYGTIDVLFTGDAGSEAEDSLVKSGYPLDAEIVKIGHHGSMYSTSKMFLSRVHPDIAIISVGSDNPYGHPHWQTLDTLTAAGVDLYRTDRDGTVRVQSDGISYSVKTDNGIGNIWTGVTTSRESFGVPSNSTSPVPTFALNPMMPETVILTKPEIPDNVTLFLSSITLPQIGNASFMQISATQFDALGDDRTNLNGEWVKLKNRGDFPVPISGWTLTDSTGSFSYTIPAFVAMPGTSVTLYTGSGMMNDTALFMGYTQPVWGNSGDIAFLKDGNGNLIDKRSEGAAG
jgi:competence protein ComEC